MKGKRKDIKRSLLIGASVLTVICGVLAWEINQSQKSRHLLKMADGDTVVLDGENSVKLVGISVGKSDEIAKEYLNVLLGNKNIWVEYEGFSKENAWVWVGCEDVPQFWAFRKTGENPVGCKKGVLANEQIVKMGWAKVSTDINIDNLKYGTRLRALLK